MCFGFKKRIGWVLMVFAILLVVVVALNSTIGCCWMNWHGNLFGVDFVEVEVAEGDVIFGSDTASLTVFIYSSYNCVYCNRFFKETYPELKKSFIDKGLMRLVVKLVEVGEDPDVLQALQSVICVSKFGNLEKLHELLLFNPRVVYSQEFKELVDYYIAENSDIAECLINHEDYKYIKNNNRVFQTLQLRGTPGFIIEDRIYRGRKRFDFFEAYIKE